MERTEDFIIWLDELKELIARIELTKKEDVQINEEFAFESFKNGITPIQCLKPEKV